MSCAILTIGTELIRGEVQNENATWLAAQLADRGLRVNELSSVGDDEGSICAALDRLCGSHQFVICTGGLGPTTDDLTRACAARLLGVPLEEDARSLELIHQRLAARGREPSASNEKQAQLPRGARVLENRLGTAPGFSMKRGSCTMFCLPGVPSEMEAMFTEVVAPALPPPSQSVLVERVRVFGMPESEANDRLAGLEERFGATLGYRAAHSELEIKWILEAQQREDERALQRRSDEVLREVRQRLGAAVYAEGKSSMAMAVGDLLAERGLSLGLAESCTGGLVSQLITQVPGSSSYYKGGICCYANSVKEGLLGVLPKTLELYGAVSLEVAREMAIGAQRILGSDLSLSITGLAGPAGGTPEKPVGLVHWAVSLNGQLTAHHAVFSGSREQIQRKAALAGLWSIRQVITASHPGGNR